MDLTDKVVMITGAANGIGAATARAMAAQGAKVAVCDVDVHGGKAVAADLGEPARFIYLDVGDGAAWDAGVREVAGTLGGIDIAFLNAGVMTRPRGTPTMAPVFEHLNYANITRSVGSNLLGVVNGTAAVLPQLEGRHGYLLVTTSPAGLAPWPVDPLYAATKAAVISWVRTMGLLLPERGVRVNALAPGGPINTGMLTDDWAQAAPGMQLVEPFVMAEAVMRILDADGDGGIFVAGRHGQITRY